MSKTSEDTAPQNFTDVCMNLPPTIQTFIKVWRFCGAISLLVFILSLSNLAIVLNLRRSFHGDDAFSLTGPCEKSNKKGIRPQSKELNIIQHR